MDISGNRGTYRGRIGDGVDCEKQGIPDGGLRRETWAAAYRIFSFCRPGKFPEKFSDIFFVKFFGRGKIFGKKFCLSPGNYFLLRG